MWTGGRASSEDKEFRVQAARYDEGLHPPSTRLVESTNSAPCQGGSPGMADTSD